MPLYTLCLLFFSDPLLHLYPAAFFYLLVVMLINTMAPAISLYVMYRRGVIDDLDIRSRGQRPLPFLVVLAYYLLTWFVVSGGDNATFVPHIYLGLVVALIAAIGGAVIITRVFKLSMHGMGTGGCLGALVGVQCLHFSPTVSLNMGLILLCGLVGWSRIALGVHTHKEVYAGTLYGFVVVFGVLLGMSTFDPI